jgi:hypothetical protein
MGESQPGKPKFRIQLIDVAAMVVGYGLAAVLFRAFWPQRSLSPALGLFALGFYAWLGLAMSGPLILLRHRHARAGGPSGKQPARPDRQTARTWAEMAWLLIGVYWIVLGVFVLPIQLQYFKFSDSILFGLVPLAAGLGLRIFGPRLRPQDCDLVFWTHQIAVGLLVTWPVAWVCLIVVAAATF